MITKGEINPFERLMRVFLAAKNNNLKVILSSWFFLHTYWFLEECDTKYIFDMTTEQKITFLHRILDVMKKENLIDIVAFAELIPRNIDGLSFHSYYAWPLYKAFEQDVIFMGFCMDHGCHEVESGCGTRGFAKMPEDMNIVHSYAAHPKSE